MSIRSNEMRLKRNKTKIIEKSDEINNNKLFKTTLKIVNLYERRSRIQDKRHSCLQYSNIDIIYENNCNSKENNLAIITLLMNASSNCQRLVFNDFELNLHFKCKYYFTSINTFVLDTSLVKNINDIILFTNYIFKAINFFDHLTLWSLHLSLKFSSNYIMFLNIKLFSNIIFVIFYLTYRHTRFRVYVSC